MWRQNWRTVKEDRHQESIRECILVLLPFIMIAISKKKKWNMKDKCYDEEQNPPGSLNCSHRSWVPYMLLERLKTKPNAQSPHWFLFFDFFWQIFLLSLDALWKASETKTLLYIASLLIWLSLKHLGTACNDPQHATRCTKAQNPMHKIRLNEI